MRNESEAWTSDDLTRQVASLRALARSLVRDVSRAEDLVQDTLVVALERPPRNRDSLRGWLATVARHLALDRARGERRRGDREQRVARKEGEEPPADPLERLEIESEVLDAVRALREPYRTTLFLRYWEDLEPAAIASKLGVPVKTIKSRLARALEELRTRLDAKVEGGRKRWMGALVPIAFPSAPATGGSGLAEAGIAGGALIVKKILIGVAAVLLIVIGWRALSGGRVERSSLASPSGLAHGIESRAEPEPTRSFVVDEAHEGLTRTAAPTAAPDAPADARGDVLVTLLHADGTPAGDYSIDVRCTGDPAPREEFLRRRTDEQGRVELTGLFAGKADVFVDRGDSASIEVVAGERREVELRLHGKLVVEGRVVGPDGAAVAGADVWIEGVRFSSRRAHRAARTASDGSFRIAELEDEAEIGARARGFSPSYTFEASTLPLGPSGAREIVLELGPSGIEVAGRVVDPSGRAVEGALVKIGEPGGGTVDLPSGLRATHPYAVPVATDAEGQFTYAGDLPEGWHPVTVSARGWPTWHGGIEAKGGAKGFVEVILLEPASIEGRVVDASGVPVEGARVTASEAHRDDWYVHPFPTPRAKSDAQGRFRLGWVASGDQEINASVWKRPEVGRARLTVRCAAGETASAELRLDPGLTITGRVIDREGRPLAGWQIDGRPEPYGRAYPRQCYTDDSGRFLLANLDADHRYRVGASPTRYLRIYPVAETAPLAPGTTDVEIVADLPGMNASVRGRLVARDGTVPVDLSVLYYRKGSDRGGYMDFDPKTGSFEQGQLLPGPYELRVYRGGQTIHRTDGFDLAPGETKDVGVLTPGGLGRIELVLEGVSETDLGHALPRLNREGHATEEFTLESGVLRSREITPGIWTVTLHHEGWFLRANQVRVEADATSRVELAPERGYETRIDCSFADPEAAWTTLESKVIDERGETIHTGPTWWPVAMENGKVRLHGLTLPEGRFVVEAWTDSGLEGSVAVEAGAGPAGQREQEIVLR